MKKLTAEKCREQFEQWFRDVEAGDDDNWSSPEYLSREWHDYLARRQLALGAWNKAIEIALPILEQQERGECEWIHWNGERALPPVDSHVRVEVRRRNGDVNQRQAQDFAWRNQPVKSGTDIIAYRIIPQQPTNQNGEQ